MKVLISGVCGFAGSHLARFLLDSHQGIEIIGLDSLARQGSETNRQALQRLGVRLFHGDLRMASDLDSLPAVDWVVDAAANPPAVLFLRDASLLGLPFNPTLPQDDTSPQLAAVQR